MAEHPICNWIGGSGQSYKYFVWDFPVKFNANQDGNYIYSKKNPANDKWVPIYIGEGDLRDRSENHHKARCILSHGATHIHGHLNPKQEDRRAEERDLLANYKNAYSPQGCNEQEGG
jgi:hypothetical protein